MKVLKYLCMAAVLLFSAAALKVEAATVAIIPLINKVEFNTVEEERVPNLIFINEAVNILKKKPGYTLSENARVRHAIEDNVDPYKLPTREQLAAICKKGNVDIVFAMELTDYDYDMLDVGRTDSRTMKMRVKANMVTYNRLTGEYVKKPCVDDSEIDEVFSSRWDPVQECWTRLVRQEFDRVTKVRSR